MLGYLMSRIVVNMLGSLYPGYRSYKAVKNRDTREYVRVSRSLCGGYLLAKVQQARQ